MISMINMLTKDGYDLTKFVSIIKLQPLPYKILMFTVLLLKALIQLVDIPPLGSTWTSAILPVIYNW